MSRNISFSMAQMRSEAWIQSFFARCANSTTGKKSNNKTIINLFMGD